MSSLAVDAGRTDFSKAPAPQICGEAIGAKRAAFLPNTRLCITHAHEIDKLGGEFKLKAMPLLDRGITLADLDAPYAGTAV